MDKTATEKLPHKQTYTIKIYTYNYANTVRLPPS